MNHRINIMIFSVINKLTNLNDHLGTLIARKECHINGAAFNARRVLVHDGIHLCVAHVHVLCVQPVQGKKSFEVLIGTPKSSYSFFEVFPQGSFSSEHPLKG